MKPEPLTPGTVRAYALAVGPMAIFGLPFSIYLPPYIAEGGVVAVGLVGLLFTATTFWDGIVDPLIGMMVDKVKLAGSHRRWIQLASLPLALLATLLVLAGDTLSFPLLLLVLLFFYSSYSLFDVAHLAWGAALTDTADESSRLFGAREWAAKFILLAAFGAPAIAQFAIPGLSLQGRILAYASLLVLALPLALFCVSKLPLRPIKPEPGLGWRAEMQTTLRFRPLLALIAVQFLNATAFGSLTALFVFFADGVLNLDDRSSLLLFGTFVGGAIFTPLWIAAARRLGKPVAMIAMVFWVVTLLLGSMFVTPSGLTQALIFSTVLGSGFVGLIFIYGMTADLMPADRRRSGRDRTGFIFALVNLMQRGGVAVAIGISYAALDMIGFDPRNAGASAEALNRLFAGLPSAAWLLMTVLLVWLARQPEMHPSSQLSR